MKRWLVFFFLGVVGPVLARDNLDTTRGHGWSPDNKWLAFNPVNQDSLFIANISGHRNFLLKPVGEVVIDTSNVFDSGGQPTNNPAGGNSAADGITMTVGSPGRSRLEVIEWSPRADALAYSIERKRRATFSVLEQTVTGIYSTTNALPWRTPDDLQVAFDFERSTTNHPSRYLLRVVRPDDTVAKELVFADPKEVQRLSLLRSSDSTFLTPDHQTLIYPHLAGKGWQLVTEKVEGSAGARPLTEIAPGAPYEWKLSPNGKTLAVVEGSTSIAIGPLDDWAKADRVTFSNLTMSVTWSPDGRYLAANDRQGLHLIEFDKATGKIVGTLARLHNSCSPQFWGWRGSRLIFSDAKEHPANLYYVDVTAADRQVQPLVKAKSWRSAPSIRTISPDGKTFVCLVMEIDGQSRLVHEIWKIKLEPGAEWEFVNRWIPGSGS